MFRKPSILVLVALTALGSLALIIVMRGRSTRLEELRNLSKPDSLPKELTVDLGCDGPYLASRIHSAADMPARPKPPAGRPVGTWSISGDRG